MGEFKSIADYYDPLKSGVEMLGVLERQQAIQQRGVYLKQEGAKLEFNMQQAVEQKADVEDLANTIKSGDMENAHFKAIRYALKHGGREGERHVFDIIGAERLEKLTGVPKAIWENADTRKAASSMFDATKLEQINKMKAQEAVLDNKLGPYVAMEKAAKPVLDAIPKVIGSARQLQSDINAYDKEHADLVNKRESDVDKTASNAAIASSVTGRESYINGLYKQSGFGPEAAKAAAPKFIEQIGALRAQAEAAGEMMEANTPGSDEFKVGKFGKDYLTAHADVIEASSKFQADPSQANEKELVAAQKKMYSAQAAFQGEKASIVNAKSNLQKARTDKTEMEIAEKQRKFDIEAGETKVHQMLGDWSEKNNTTPERAPRGLINTYAKKEGVNPQDIWDQIHGKPKETNAAEQFNEHRKLYNDVFHQAAILSGAGAMFTISNGELSMNPDYKGKGPDLKRFADVLDKHADSRNIPVNIKTELHDAASAMRKATPEQVKEPGFWERHFGGTQPTPTAPVSTSANPPPGLSFEQFKAWRRARGQ